MARTDSLTPAAALLDAQRFNSVEITGDGYLDTLGGDPPPVHSVGQRLMRTTGYATGYQYFRPLGFRLLGGPSASGSDAERARIAGLLDLRPGHVMLDIGCGPGNFTGWFGSQVFPSGLAVGVDASHQMLRRAVADNSGPGIAYVRGDAENLPFADGVADAVSCLAALYLINDPFRAIEEIARVLQPGGRVAILTSLAPGGRADTVPVAVAERLSGIRMFGRHEITDSLHEAGFAWIDQHTGGLAQTVTAIKREEPSR